MKAAKAPSWPYIYATLSVVNVKTLGVEQRLLVAKGGQAFANETLPAGACFVPRVLRRGAHAGRLVIPSDHKRTLAGKQLEWSSHMMFSDDGGKSWQISAPIQTGGNECQVIEREDGSLLVNTRMQGGWQGMRGVATSTDGGTTWTAITHEKQLPCPKCQASLLRYDDKRLLFSNPFPPEPKDGKPSGARVRMTVRRSTGFPAADRQIAASPAFDTAFFQKIFTFLPKSPSPSPASGDQFEVERKADKVMVEERRKSGRFRFGRSRMKKRPELLTHRAATLNKAMQRTRDKIGRCSSSMVASR